MRLLLIRHAESENNRSEADTGSGAYRVPDPVLTDLGTTQAAKLAAHVAAGHLPRPDVLLTSLMKRTVLTAAPLADALDLPLEGHAYLHEVSGVYEGEYTGHDTQGTPVPGSPASVLLSISSRLALPPEADETGWYRRPFETPAVAWQRAQDVVRELRSRFTGTDQLVGLVTHGWFSQYLLRALLHLPVAADAALPVWLELNNTGTALVRPSHDAHHHVVLEWLNRTDHLEDTELSR